MGLQISIDTSALDELQAQVEADPKPVMRRLAERLAGSVRRRLESVALAPSPATLEIRQRRGRSGTAPLRDTGEMADSIMPRSSARSAGAYVRWPALPHQVGAVTGKRSAIPGKTIPARPFVMLDDSDVEAAVESIADHYAP